MKYLLNAADLQGSSSHWVRRELETMGCNANSPATLPLTMGIESTVTLEIFVNASPSTANTDGASLNPWLADDDCNYNITAFSNFLLKSCLRFSFG